MLPQASYIIKARQWPILLIFLLTGGPFLSALFLDRYDKVAGLFFRFVTLLCLLFYIINSKHYLYLDNDQLIYRTILYRREIKWRDITSSDVNWTLEGLHSASKNWKFITDKQLLEIRLGFFSRSDMQALAQQLIEQAPQAVLSKQIYQFAEGKFPWYLF